MKEKKAEQEAAEAKAAEQETAESAEAAKSFIEIAGRF